MRSPTCDVDCTMPAVSPGRYVCFHSLLLGLGYDGIAVIASVRQLVFGYYVGSQVWGLGAVGGVPSVRAIRTGSPWESTARCSVITT